jgi:KaiC/GvpD/RAD55 family RecA-like ATPase
MGYWKTTTREKDLTETKEAVKDIETYPILAIPSRNLTKETCELLGIRSGLSEEDGSTVVAHYFPYYDQRGKLVGYKKRDLTKDKAEKGHFTTIGGVSVTCKLFGQQYAESLHRKRKNLIFVEGEYDVASALQAMIDSVQDTRYSTLRPFIVGLSCGTANAVEATLHNEEFVKSFETVTLGFDGDETTPAEKKKGIKRGKEATEDVAGALLLSEMYVVNYDAGYKDPSDYVQAGDSEELAKILSFGKKKHSVEKIVRASDIAFEDVVQKRKEGVYINQFPKLMKKIHGFRKREMVVVTAPSGVGKSTLTSLFASGFFEAGERVGMIYLEETKVETMQRLLAARLKINYLEFKNDPLSCASKEEIKAAYDALVKEDMLIVMDHFGSMPIGEMMSKIKHMVLVEKCGYIVVDHVSAIISGTEIDNERKELDIVMTALAAFCASNDVGLIVVSHINRTNAAQFLPPKGHPEGEPYWVRVTKESLRGSATLEQFAWIILGLEPEIMGDRSRGRVRIVVLKNRPWSEMGVADVFDMDEDWNVILSEEETY